MTDLDITRYLTPSELHLICGRSGVGKTHALFQILNTYRSKLGKLLYLATDRRQEAYQGLFAKGNIPEWPLFSKISLGAAELGSAKSYDDEINRKLANVENRKECFRWLDSMVKIHEPDTVVVDVAQRFVPCANLNQSASVAGGMGVMAEWAVHHKLTTILVWHPNKQLREKLNDPFDLISHSHVVQGLTSTKAILEQSDGSNYTMTLRGPTFPDVIIDLSKDDNGFFKVESDESQLTAALPIYEHVGTEATPLAVIVDAAQHDQRVSATSDKAIRIHLGKLIDAGLIEKPRRGQYQRVTSS